LNSLHGGQHKLTFGAITSYMSTILICKRFKWLRIIYCCRNCHVTRLVLTLFPQYLRHHCSNWSQNTGGYRFFWLTVDEILA